ncbi:actin-related protein 2/3 complex subunit 2A [Cucumis melo var. makuwa]|uniref:Arp2/3 complex 34 kDa subunit n=1 Tax=Cucumis melo var. makuwa TaxID=1194695 RepID=A0A5A7UG04_CUCMM|nr:actin-related protein 2/3 complex subunit 2A [Cucumis melo var. makuwa]
MIRPLIWSLILGPLRKEGFDSCTLFPGRVTKKTTIDDTIAVPLQISAPDFIKSGAQVVAFVRWDVVGSLEKAVEVDYNWVEFDDVRYHVQVSMKNPHLFLLSVSLPIPSADTVFCGGLPSGAIEAIKAAYGILVQILDPPRDGFNLTLKLNLSKLPLDEDNRHTVLVKLASIREVVLGAPLRGILKQLGSRVVASDVNKLVALVHRPKESFFLVPQAEKVTVVFPMRFKDSIDIALATSFLQEFVEARRTAGLNNAPPCSWSLSPPQELKGAPSDALSANAGFVTFGNV